VTRCRWAVAGAAALMLLCSLPSSPAAEEKPAAEGKAGADNKSGAGEGAVFKLQEVSIFDQKQDAELARLPMFGGQTAQCSSQPAKEVKAYPKLKSKRPLYGAIILNRDPAKPGPAMKFYFVLDESGTPEQPAKKPDEKPAEKSGENVAGPGILGVLAESARPKYHYDRLYFDANHDLDLTNDPVISLMKDPPEGVFRSGLDRQYYRVFDAVTASLGDDPTVKGQSVRMLPVLIAYSGQGSMTFMATSAHKGEIRLGKRAYQAVLVQQGGMIGRLDRPNTPLFLTPVDGPKQPRMSYGMDTLGTMREADGEFYTLSATPSGDELTVRPYRGDCGVLEVSAGKREIKELGIAGLLRSKDSMLPLGDMVFPLPTERAKVAKYRLPVGDYQPMILYVDYGSLQVNLRPNYNLPAASGAKPGCTMEIRKDKPYVLDFSGKPAVTFLGPPKEKVFKPGEDVRLSAMLGDPDKGLLIGGLEDTSQKVGEMKWMAEGGKQMSAPRYASLDPTVVIADSSGKKVASGKMPFG
jgi:hypothetical protein